jgi:beta-xylosidase/uncharacterized protein YjdB
MNKKKTWKKVLALFMTAVLLLSGYTPTVMKSEAAAATSRKRVSVHDPSVVKEGNTYYIFGSHLAWAKSTDLENWTTFTNNINKDYKTLFADEFEWASSGDSAYAESGNMWAPDVIWNKDLNKWCMYMSINGCSWNSAICMLTADSLDGNWTKVGTVVYSGFDDGSTYSYTRTDYQEVTGDTSLPDRYLRDAYTCSDGTTTCTATRWNRSYGAHAIDPCVFYDEDGQLWMTYGSWSGGIYMFRLDSKTGFRDNSEEAKSNYTDAYMGKLIAKGSSGEASYVQHIGDYYYLFVSYGGLVAAGGYNMRVFRSENPDGPYTDISGDAATKGGDINGTVGERLMSYYKWSFWKNAQVAQGHNSAFVDDDGNAYVVYHTRTNNGTEYHSVRVHQLFTTESGYLVAAPFEYSSTDTVKATGYSASEIAGEYEVMMQKGTDYSTLRYNSTNQITLTEDGKVTGAYTGTWSEKDGTANLTITVNDETYEGTFVEQTLEEEGTKTICFTAVGQTNEICFWGAKYRNPNLSDTSSSVGAGTFYSQDYEGNVVGSSIWSITGSVSIDTDTTDVVNKSKCAIITPTGSGNRGAVTGFDYSTEPYGVYDIETEVMLSSSTGNSGSTTPKTEFAFTCQDKTYTDGNKNVGLASGYILKLSASGTSNQTFTINDVEADTVTLPSTDWIRIKVTMDSSDLTKGILTITDLSTNTVLVDNKEIAVNGEGKLEGMYLLLGRGTGSQAKVDNTSVKAYQEPTPEPAATPTPTASATQKPSSSAAQTPAESEEDSTPAESVTVKAAGYLGKSVTLKKGKKIKIKSAVSPSAASQEVTYKSSKSSVASVNAKGVVRAKKAGQAKITITSADGNASAVYKITVVNKAKKVKSFKLKKTTLKVRRGKTATLALKSITKGGTDTFTYQSDNAKVAKADRYGVIRAVKAGKTKITVKCGKKKVKVNVTVFTK